jgi:UDP-N-acetylglucosamine--N-acetylmuramyl-(pentapeptide) pyrophosphoryl-undecaprenol N-acetylglucosamine transferase
VLVPYPFAAANHQVENAKAMVEADAAVMVLDNELDAKLKETIISLMEDDERRKRMSERSRQLGRPEAAKVVAEAVLQLAQRSSPHIN